MKTLTSTCLSLLAAASCMAAQADNIAVRVNGDRVYFHGTQPRQINGRVMVPLRGVLEQLGANVEWNASADTVVATRGNTEINLPIGSRFATVNGREVRLDVPAMTLGGSTMVPLRFVSESLGANVVWLSQTQTVMIDSPGTFRAYRRQTATDDRTNYSESRSRYDDTRYNDNRGTASRVVLPAGMVIPVRLDDRLRSDENVAGDRFTATVESGRDDAGLPSGTKFEGVVREAIPSRSGKPGVLDIEFRRIILPDGTSRNIRAGLTSLDGKYVDRDRSGRLTAKGRSSNERLKWVGIGAGAGLLIGTLTKGNQLLDTILGAGAGYLYNEYANKGGRNVDLKAGTELGARVDQRIAIAMNRGY